MLFWCVRLKHGAFFPCCVASLFLKVRGGGQGGRRAHGVRRLLLQEAAASPGPRCFVLFGLVFGVGCFCFVSFCFVCFVKCEVKQHASKGRVVFEVLDCQGLTVVPPELRSRIGAQTCGGVACGGVGGRDCVVVRFGFWRLFGCLCQAHLRVEQGLPAGRSCSTPSCAAGAAAGTAASLGEGA